MEDGMDVPVDNAVETARGSADSAALELKRFSVSYARLALLREVRLSVEIEWCAQRQSTELPLGVRKLIAVARAARVRRPNSVARRAVSGPRLD
jgi:hypothetical protein